jgi:hypothetical protein
MTIPRINSVGFCAHYSQQGDRAFDYALKLCKENDLRLNVFHFLSSPYEPDDESMKSLPGEELERIAVERERELRLYYDQRAGDYLEVGFRLCYDDSWTELHRCLMIREFQLLVLAVPEEGARFSRHPIEEWAETFISPVVLVGPDGPGRFRLNSRAALLVDRLGIPEGQWSLIQGVAV